MSRSRDLTKVYKQLINVRASATRAMAYGNPEDPDEIGIRVARIYTRLGALLGDVADVLIEIDPSGYEPLDDLDEDYWD